MKKLPTIFELVFLRIYLEDYDGAKSVFSEDYSVKSWKDFQKVFSKTVCSYFKDFETNKPINIGNYDKKNWNNNFKTKNKVPKIIDKEDFKRKYITRNIKTRYPESLTSDMDTRLHKNIKRSIAFVLGFFHWDHLEEDKACGYKKLKNLKPELFKPENLAIIEKLKDKAIKEKERLDKEKEKPVTEESFETVPFWKKRPRRWSYLLVLLLIILLQNDEVRIRKKEKEKDETIQVNPKNIKATLDSKKSTTFHDRVNETDVLILSFNKGTSEIFPECLEEDMRRVLEEFPDIKIGRRDSFINTNDKSLNIMHDNARTIGRTEGAKIVLWGKRIKDDKSKKVKTYSYITIVDEIDTKYIDSKDYTLKPYFLNEIEVPEELLKKGSFLAKMVYIYKLFEEKRSEETILLCQKLLNDPYCPPEIVRVLMHVIGDSKIILVNESKFQLSSYESAMQTYFELLEEFDGDIFAQLRIGQLYLLLNNYSKALEYLLPVAQSDHEEESKTAYRHLAWVSAQKYYGYSNRGNIGVPNIENPLFNLDKAFQYIQKAVVNDHYETLLFKAKILTKMGRLNEAIQIYLELKNHISKDYRLYYELGMSLVLNRQYFKAIESFETSIKENPKSTASYKRLGELNYNLGKVYEAKKMFMKADALNNRSVMTIKFLACSYIILDNDIDSAVLQLMRLPEFRGKKGKPQYSHYKSILNPPINLINPNTITFREAQ